MKKVTIVIFAALLIAVGACGSKKDEVEKTKIKINENAVYAKPKNPTDYQAKTYNKLTKVLSGGSSQEVAELVAQNFSADFFTLKNKKSSDDIGGMTYFPADKVEEFKPLVSNYVYVNYQKIIDDKGKSELPVVKKVKIDSTTRETRLYTITTPANEELGTVEEKNEEEFEAYVITVTIEYEKTDVKDTDLKKKTVFKVIEIDGRLVLVEMSN